MLIWTQLTKTCRSDRATTYNSCLTLFFCLQIWIWRMALICDRHWGTAHKAKHCFPKRVHQQEAPRGEPITLQCTTVKFPSSGAPHQNPVTSCPNIFSTGRWIFKELLWSCVGHKIQQYPFWLSPRLFGNPLQLIPQTQGMGPWLIPTKLWTMCL